MVDQKDRPGREKIAQLVWNVAKALLKAVVEELERQIGVYFRTADDME